MLLTRRCRKVLIVPYWNWNRKKASKQGWKSCSNCTLLELKQEIVSRNAKCLAVLIVPYWNWNDVIIPPVLNTNSVLIVPYWNWNYGRSRRHILAVSSNCTLLELKRSNTHKGGLRKCVLIVPYWNWNRQHTKSKARERTVLIVPYWNWNYSEYRVLTRFDKCSNCTLLELKPT